MNRRALLSIGSAILVLGGVVAEAKTLSSADLARRGAKALARRDPTAVTLAEQAVAAAPGEAGYRALLGRAYLQAGRFASARTAFTETLRLRSDDGRSALHLVLATIATGDWQGARAILAANEGQIGATDRGLALAMAGDPAGGVALLMQAAREPGATARTRQNLALALALAGQWPLARAVAAADLSPADVDRRIAEWAQFAQPAAASDQIAALLGVQAAPDQGQPVALALAEAPVELAAAVPAAASAPVPPSAPVVIFGPRREVVQPLPAQLMRGTSTRVAQSTWAPRAAGRRKWQRG